MLLLFIALPGPIGTAEAAPTPHGPISITSNSDLTATAAAEGWPGTGTSNAPFIISGYSIDASAATGIYIANIGLHVEVRGNKITDPIGGSAHHGIVVDDSPVRIIGNKIAVEGTGIHVSGSGPSVEQDIFEAIISGVTSPIFGAEFTPAPIRWNTIDRASTGIRLASSSSSWPVAYNEVHNTGNGIYASPSESTSPIRYNQIVGCSGIGITAVADEGGTAAAVTNNDITNCAAGILTSRGSSISSNVIEGVTGNAIHTYDGGNIVNNRIDGASTGIRSQLDPNSVIRGNSVHNTLGHGMRIDEVIAIENNLVEDAGGHGIYVGLQFGLFLEGTTLSDNIVRNVGGIGIRTNFVAVTGNHVEETGSHGIVALNAGCVSSNTVKQAGGDGIQAYGASCLSENLVAESTGHGIWADHVYGSVEDNVARENGGDGILVDYLDGSVHGNTAIENAGHGIRIAVGGGPFGSNEFDLIRDPFEATDNVATGNGGNGLDLTSSDEFGSPNFPTALLTGNQVSDNTVGIRLVDFLTSTFSGNRIDGNDVGLSLEETRQLDDLLPAPGAVEAGAHDVFDNAFDNTINAQVDAGTAVKWYTDARPLLPGETNIAGGSWLGGNLWGNYAGTDADGDGLGDTPHQPTADPVRLDRYPLV